MKLLKKTKVKKELRRTKKGVLNIQLFTIWSPPHSSSSLECAKKKVYNVKIQFAHMIIQDINTTGTSIVEVLHKNKQRWHVREQT